MENKKENICQKTGIFDTLYIPFFNISVQLLKNSNLHSSVYFNKIAKKISKLLIVCSKSVPINDKKQYFKAYQKVIKQIQSNLDCRSLILKDSKYGQTLNQHKDRFIDKLSSKNSHTTIDESNIENSINQFIQKISNGQLQTSKNKCIKCSQFLYLNDYIPSYPYGHQLSYIYPKILHNYEQLFQIVMGVGNCGGVLFISEQNVVYDKCVQGLVIDENKKQELQANMKQKFYYLMPQQMKKQFVMQFIPIKLHPLSKKIKQQNKGMFLKGHYVIRIYFKKTQAQKHVIYKNYKGGAYKNTSKYEIYVLQNGKSCKLQSEYIYKQIHNRYKHPLPTTKIHYNIQCLKPYQGSKEYTASLQKQTIVQPSQGYSSLKKRTIIQCFFTDKQQVRQKIDKKFKKQKMIFQIKYYDNEKIDNKSKIVLSILHEQSHKDVQKLIRLIDIDKKMQAYRVTVHILVNQLVEFQKIQNELQKIMLPYHQHNFKFLYEKTIISDYSEAGQASNKQVTLVILSSKTLEYCERLYAQVFYFVRERKIRFIKDQQFQQLKNKAKHKGYQSYFIQPPSLKDV